MAAPDFVELFEPRDDERLVFSACAAKREDGSSELVHGTLLAVPEECAERSWERRRSEREPTFPAEVAIEGERWLLTRRLVSIEEADAWLQEAFEALEGERELALPGGLGGLVASLGAPDVWRRVMPHTDTPTSSLIAGLGRPVEGIYLPARGEPEFAAPERLEHRGAWSFSPALGVTGVHVTPPGIAGELATARGLLVGRAERRAWLGDSRGQENFERFNAEVHFDPEQIDLDQLELTHNELLGGDLALSNRFQLRGGVALSGETAIASIPTIGRSVAHELLLHTAEGELLDRSGLYPLAERIEILVSIEGEEAIPITSGVSGEPPRIGERIARSRQVAVELGEQRRADAEAWIIRDRESGLERVSALLGRARRELMVLDRFFGQHQDEWALLGELAVPVRVVSAKIETDEEKAPVAVRMPANVEARFRPKAPIHDRVYLWRGGGFWLGGSLSTLGQAPIGSGELSRDESALWIEIFEALWGSELMRPVPKVEEAGEGQGVER